MFNLLKSRLLPIINQHVNPVVDVFIIEPNPEAWLRRWMQLQVPTCRLRINNNRVTMISMRHSPQGMIISIHAELFQFPLAIAELPMWILSKGDHVGKPLTAALNKVFSQQRMTTLATKRADLPPLPPPIHPLDLQGALDHVHGTWFAFLSKPQIKWGKNPGLRNLSSIRFGCYTRRPQALITLHPRLRRKWVPWIFIEHVIFHELCHHRQVYEPIAREAHHSARFQQWERAYPHHKLATEWQALFLDHMLKGSTEYYLSDQDIHTASLSP